MMHASKLAGDPALPLEPPTEDAQMSTIVVSHDVALEVEQVGVVSARNGMPGLIRRSTENGQGFLIKNGKNAGAATALLIDLEVLRDKFRDSRPLRTLGQLLESLPYRHQGDNPRIASAALPHDVLPVYAVPGEAGPVRPRVHRSGATKR
ncbi:hypothetical protein D3C78_938390 [compost metagenome]